MKKIAENKLDESLEYLKEVICANKDTWVPSSRGNNTGVGKTFEDLLGKVEDNLAEPDLAQLEIKSQRMNSQSKTTLFTKSPVYPLGANTYIKDNFGVNDAQFPDTKIIHTSFFGNKINTYKNRHGFKLEADDEKQKLHLKVYDTNNNEINLDNDIYWTYPCLEQIINEKIANVGFVQAKTKSENGEEYFKYEKLTVLMNPSLEKFINNVKDGTIQFDIRIGVYRSGKNAGKPHDHGSGFRIAKKDFHKLYGEVKNIDFNEK